MIEQMMELETAPPAFASRGAENSSVALLASGKSGGEGLQPVDRTSGSGLFLGSPSIRGQVHGPPGLRAES